MLHTMGISTIMTFLLFGINAVLFCLFQAIKIFNGGSLKSPSDDNDKKEKKIEVKEMSKPFVGTIDCFTNLTSELFRTGMVMLLTYICERHWIYEHSGKTYSRDLFLFVILVFFIYGFYTIKPVHDLTLLSREQTEEWKGWMQFIFLLYHYFHAEEAYNSVRVMITCYVWMTGFGNFSFFYTKQDFGWLRFVQMLWRLNFSVLLLMWTHGNTWILYYICPMHTFYFAMVYVTMYLFSSVNHSKWGIRFKLLALGILIYVIWDVNGGLFDILFSWLGTNSVIGATNGSVWEYYFRTSLDHWSSFFGMIFAMNFPLAEQFFPRAKGWPLFITAVLMAALTLWWLTNIYSLEKFTYNLSHSYFAIIPLTSYIFFRNITPFTRSYVSMSMHDLGKTTLETYLLQHHIWLTSNAKTLLTIVPGHPWINFALATVLFFQVSKELYRLTMSLRGMILPDDGAIAWKNLLGTCVSVLLLFAIAAILQSFEATVIEILVTSLGLSLVTILIINRFARQTSEIPSYQFWSVRCSWIIIGLFCTGIIVQLMFNAVEVPAELGVQVRSISTIGSPCLNSISKGHWVVTKCDEPPSGPNKLAFCETDQWVWDDATNDCPIISKVTNNKAKAAFKSKHILFVGDSLIRNAYHEFNKILDPKYKQVSNISLKHSNLERKHPSVGNATVSFVWAPLTQNITSYFNAVSLTKKFDSIIFGAAAWDALYNRDAEKYLSNLNELAKFIPFNPNAVNVWIQSTSVVDGRLGTPDKQQYMTEGTLKEYRNVFSSSLLAQKIQVVVDPTSVSKGRESNSIDGIHYGEEVYTVIAQMIANAYVLHFPLPAAIKRPVAKIGTPKRTGSMSVPANGAIALLMAIIMIFTMDSFFGFGYISLKLFGRSLDWDLAYAPLLMKIGGRRSNSGGGGGATSPTQESESLLADSSGNDHQKTHGNGHGHSEIELGISKDKESK